MHLGTLKMHSASPDSSQIYHHLAKNGGSETIYAGFCFDRKIPGVMAFRKRPDQMDSTLVETQGSL